MAFVNCLDQMDNLNGTLEFPILKHKTTFEQTLSVSLNVSKFDSGLLMAPRTLKDFIHLYNCKKEILDLNERHDNTDKKLPNKHFFSNNFIVDNFLFVTAIISLQVTNLTIYLLCEHRKLGLLVASLALQQVREVGTVTAEKEVTYGCI